MLGQAKKSIVLDLKKPEAVEIARPLAAKSDILIENFATGVMDRLGLGAEALKALNPDLIYISASGMGRTGTRCARGRVWNAAAVLCRVRRAQSPSASRAAHRPGVARSDVRPDARLRRRRSALAPAAEGGVARVDFSMLEAMLWTMAEPLLATQLGAPPQPMGNASPRYAPHGAWRCAGDDEWISIAVRTDAEWRALCDLVPGLSGMAALDLGERIAAQIRNRCGPDRLGRRTIRLRPPPQSLLKAGIPAAALARHGDLVKSPHLAARGFWDKHGTGVLPGLPWRASFGRTIGPAPELGADSDHVLARRPRAVAGTHRRPADELGASSRRRESRSELAAAIRIVEALRVLFR